MIIQLCGLSGAGKSTLAQQAKAELEAQGIPVEIIDGDDYRRHINKDLRFSRDDRMENIRRLGFIADRFSKHGIVAILCAINPYEQIRAEIRKKYNGVQTVYVKCDIEELIRRDTKGLYKRALLPKDHKDKIDNLSGMGDPFEDVTDADLIISTDKESVSSSAKKFIEFIRSKRVETGK